MGLTDKLDNAKDDAAGKAKEATGKATDNERLEAEGKADQTEADLKQAGEKVKDAFKRLSAHHTDGEPSPLRGDRPASRCGCRARRLPGAARAPAAPATGEPTAAGEARAARAARRAREGAARRRRERVHAVGDPAEASRSSPMYHSGA